MKEIDDILGKVCDNTVEKIINLNKDINGNIKGKEEEFNHQLSSEITLHLIDEIEKSLNGKKINGVKFRVKSYKKREENLTGADLIGILEINYNGQKISKAYLAQGKIADIKKRKSNKSQYIYCYNQDILRQTNNMLNITSDSFFFLYTKKGIIVVPSLGVKLSNKNSIKSSDHYYFNFGDFYKNFFKCFIGDHKIAPFFNKPSELIEYIEQVGYNKAIYIQANVSQKD
jgi:hypothetical protein